MTAILYRHYDRAALDVQYNARATVPDVAPFLAQYAVHSQWARDNLPCHLDVPFGDHPDETIDVFPARGPGPAPVFIFVHGGYWRALSKDDSSGMAPTFTQAGAMVIAVNYSLAPGATLDTIVDQVRRAVAWAYHHAADYGGDPLRLHVAGSSAGGHLVGMLLMDGWQAALGLPAQVVRGAVALSGLFDLRPLVHTHINAWMNLSDADAVRNSPALHLPEQGPPLIVSHGGNETDEFKRQTRDYLHDWQARGFTGHCVDMPDTNHFDIVTTLNDPQAPLTRAVLAQMGLQANGGATPPNETAS
jgi:arylformamidase